MDIPKVLKKVVEIVWYGYIFLSKYILQNAPQNY